MRARADVAQLVEHSHGKEGCGTQPPSGPNHWWLFSAQLASSSQQQSYPAATETQFDRFLGGASVSSPV
jgi:hypothetical protein